MYKGGEHFTAFSRTKGNNQTKQDNSKDYMMLYKATTISIANDFGFWSNYRPL